MPTKSCDPALPGLNMISPVLGSQLIPAGKVPFQAPVQGIGLFAAKGAL